MDSRYFKITLLLVLFAAVNLSAQIDSFEKTYSLNNGLFSGYQVISADNNTFLISGYNNTARGILKAYKLDENGNILWSQIYSTSHATTGNAAPALKISDNEYWLATTAGKSEEKRVKLIMINSDGDSTNSIIYNGDNSEYGITVLKNGENYLIAAAKKISSFSYKALKIINVDSGGNVLWSNEFELESSSSVGYCFKAYGNSLFAAAGSDSVIFINNVGKKVHSIVPDKNITSVLVYNENLLIGGTSHFTMYDYDGNIIWQNDGSSKGKLLSFSNKGITSYTGNLRDKTLSLINENGEITKTIPVRAEISDLVYIGNSYYATGYFSNQLYFLKIDNEFDYSALDLLSPDGNEKYNILDEDIVVDINWYNYNITDVNISFSSDNGDSWESVAVSIPADDKEFQWTLPEINSYECLIKLTAGSGNNLYDISSAPFMIAPVYTAQSNYIAANNIKMWIGNNGMSAHDPTDDNSGLLWPGGKEATLSVVFADGILWGGIVGRESRVNGATYRYGLTPGPILEDGTPDDPTNPKNKVYKLKEGWENSTGVDKEEYQYNYNNWSGEHGAPYTDINGDELFTQGVDEPLIIGDETLFYVSNDLNPATTSNTYGTLPIGLEYQQTVYAYKTEDFEDVVFKKVKIINKDEDPVEDMYIAYWADDDLGYAGDDFIGCDTLLSLGYTYNGDNNDDDNFGEAPPAVGRVLLQGPVIPFEMDTALIDGKKIPGYKNLPITSAMFYVGGSSIYSDPELGTPAGAEQFYNNFCGLLWDGSPIVNPNTSEKSNYVLAGDPVGETGWYEGDGWPGGPTPGDRRSIIASGPFNFEPGDTQSVVFAIFLARGTDNINSVAKLKEKAIELHEFWGNHIPTDVVDAAIQIPEQYSLSQNYPNPFNPTTTIEYYVPLETQYIASLQHVSLNVYDILGSKVATLVNERQKPGSYKVKFDGSRLSSGLYFYQLKTDRIITTKKMILLK